MVLSVALGLALAIAYGGRFDACAAVTVFPVWAWLAPGLTLAVAGLGRRGNRLVAVVIASWLGFLLAFAEEPWSLARLATTPGPEWQAARKRGDAIRVVSLNCNIGNAKAAEEVIRYRPDIVLLQESPSRVAIEAIGKTLFGADAGIVHGPDASMIVRGRVVAADLPPVLRAYFVQARIRLATGIEVEVVSTRLVPAVFRADLWSPDCWREQAANRRTRREQLRAIVRRIEPIIEDVPIIFGGDLNAPQGDAAFRPLRPHLRDAFRDAGRGWGNTIVNDLPFLRIDQIWTTETFRAVNVVARETRNSDHRMVICDLILRAPSR